MNEFIKIFLGVSALALTFLFGRNYGEKTFHESVEYRNIMKASEELSFAKNELENVKAKLQNITDQAENKKTEELLAQILHVFLTDLGLRIQNKEAILKKAEISTAAKPAAKLAHSALSAPANPDAILLKPNAQKNTALARANKFKSFESIVQNSNGDHGTLRDLKKVQIKNLHSFLKQADYTSDENCDQLRGVYKGSIKDINNTYFGSLDFQLKTGTDKGGRPGSGTNNGTNNITGKVAWYNNQRLVTEKIQNNCGRKIKGLDGRVFNLASDKYIQLYKLNSAKLNPAEKMAGNFYEVLPNGTTKIIGSFVLKRVDRF